MDFWKKFDQEWAELNQHTNKYSNDHNHVDKSYYSKFGAPKRSTRPRPCRQTQSPERIPSGPRGQDRVGAEPKRLRLPQPSRSSSADKTHDGSRQPCRRGWMPSLLARSFRLNSSHVSSCPRQIPFAPTRETS